MSMSQKNIHTQVIRLTPRRRGLYFAGGGVVAIVIAIVVICAPVKVSMNNVDAQSAGSGSGSDSAPNPPAAGQDPATSTPPAPLQLDPGNDGICEDKGQMVTCNRPPTTDDSSDPDNDGITGDNDKCPDEAETVNLLNDDDGCAETDAERLTQLEYLRAKHGEFLRQHGNRLGALERRVGLLEQSANLQVNTTNTVAAQPQKKTTIQTTDVFVLNGKRVDNLPPEVRKAIVAAATKQN